MTKEEGKKVIIDGLEKRKGIATDTVDVSMMLPNVRVDIVCELLHQLVEEGKVIHTQPMLHHNYELA